MTDQTLQGFFNRFPQDEQRFGVVREAVDELPVIDVGAFVHGGSEAEKRQTARQIRDASINLGFFFITNHGQSQAELDEMLGWTRKLFDLPKAVLETLDQKYNPSSFGWCPPERENLRYSEDSQPDVKDAFGMGREIVDEGDTMRGKPLACGPNTYPPDEALPGFKTWAQGQLVRSQRTAEALMRAIAMSLGLDESWFDPLHDYPYGSLRMNHYPPMSEEQCARRLWSCGAHTDYVGLTILLQDDIGGLEVCNVAGQWIKVPVIEGALIVNFGDLMAMWTNDLYASTPHRVRNLSGRVRYSVPYFYGPSSTTVIECLDICRSPGNPPRYPPTTICDHLVSLMAQTHPLDTIQNFSGFEDIAANRD